MFLYNFFLCIYLFPDGPDNSQGIVTCSVSPQSDSSQFTNVTICINPPDGLRCIEGYDFVLNDTSQLSSESPVHVCASFVIDKTLGKPYIDGKIYSLDGEGKRGEIPRLFNITGWLFTVVHVAA